MSVLEVSIGAVLGCAIVVALLWWSYHVVEHNTCLVMLRFGKDPYILGPGMHFDLWGTPVRRTWTRNEDTNGQTRAMRYYIKAVPMREQTHDLPGFVVRTKDGVNVTVDTVMTYRITDPRKAMLDIDDLYANIEAVVRASLQRIVNQFTYKEVGQSSAEIAAEVMTDFERQKDVWGTDCRSFRVQRFIVPKELFSAEMSAAAAVQQTAAERARLESQNALELERIRLDAAKEQAQREQELLRVKHDAAMYKLMAEAGMSQEYLIALKENEGLLELAQSPNAKIVVPCASMMRRDWKA